MTMMTIEKNMHPISSLQHGWLNLYKPLGLSSAQAVGRVKRILKPLIPKLHIGHAGTLDPLADGVLPLALGEATKLISYVMDGRKTYDFTVKFGVATSTEDSEGEVTETSNVLPDAEAIRAIMPAFMGEITQIPPAYSAIHIDGKRAYALARAGQAVEMPPRQVMIYHIEYIGNSTPDEAQFRVDCGKGTYVRALGRDIARKLGSLGHLTRLTRSKVGHFRLEHTISLESLAEIVHNDAPEVSAPGICPIAAVLADIPVLQVTAEQATLLKQGRAISHAMIDNAPTVIALFEGLPCAILERRAALWHPVRGFVYNH